MGDERRRRVGRAGEGGGGVCVGEGNGLKNSISKITHRIKNRKKLRKKEIQ